jgi:hypothetical protein
MGTEKRLYVAQYYPQLDSKTGHSTRMCWSSTCAMALKFLKPSALKGVNADDDYLRTVLKFGDTIFPKSHIKALATYGIRATNTTKATKADIIKEIDSGYPVALGVLHHGPATSPRGGGHWFLGIGYTDQHLIVHDPYGEMDNVNGGYPKPGIGGKSVKYTWLNFLRRWQPEGPGHGYMMTFRRIEVPSIVKPTSSPDQIRPSYPNTWEGVLAAAKAAGARHPETVAAQWALESGWGKHVSGKNNYFGIKGIKGSLRPTTEFINGFEVPVTATFMDFPDLYACVKYLVDRWYNDYKGYKGVNRASSATEAARLLIIEGYATDPKYTQKLIALINSKKKDAPAPI